MCGTCGCGETLQDRRVRTVELEQRVLARNDELAERNREWLRERGIVAVNLMSSPGAGKTTLLERTARTFDDVPLGVVEGDQAMSLDTDRLRALGSRVVQINTGTGCHLDAAMLAEALRSLDPVRNSVVFVENVGNLVCPALFDLGENARVVIASVTEGEDKPLKYPHMFRAADLVLLNKVDLLPHLGFDVDRFRGTVDRTRPGVEVLPVSALSGTGFDRWHDWLRERTPAASGSPVG
ncbi:hydrogenase accessory protein HypB [Saccharopolyspora subtropica]|uniref:Hydrogenase accessory protein HypB n=1 Tax=Saccharopolyspora thermophila TaxID=89367 RepID=A0A917JUC0_9PSEU|nr:hydrogenase nickel incorporation protein HypB [Saccharopolyspora subtropica]GGI86985.1 hydrogenase accessory protein HypB [Saccharopolyspora subtropica]